MRDWKDVLISPLLSIREVIEKITRNALQICLVINDDKKLIGTVTDGDIRYGILKGLSLDDSVASIMNSSPTVVRQCEGRSSILDLMVKKKIHHIPVIDDQGRVLDLETLDDIINPEKKKNGVVLMAGGLGRRLRPLTDDCPKPMLKIAGKPILEKIIENLIEYGFWKFFISVNYKAEKVTSYFGDGSRWGVEIQYIHEKERMGTAGALSNLPECPEIPLLVMNADLITSVNFNNLISYHEQHQAKATMCVREYDFQVPYGVVQLDGNRFVGIEEKPVKHFFVNAGIYLLDPELLGYIPSGSYYDMPQLFEHLSCEKVGVSVFPINEYWQDIGRMDDYTQAANKFGEAP